MTIPTDVGALLQGAFIESSAVPGTWGMKALNSTGGDISGGGGSTTANQGTPNTTANAWPIKVTDGVHQANILALDSVVTTANFGILTLSQMYVQLSGGGIIPLQLTPGNAIQVDGSAVTQPVSAASLPLPSGASTAANQSTANATLSGIEANQTNGTQVTSVNNFPATQPISAVSLPLPTGASTSANQSSEIAQLVAINNNQTNGNQITQVSTSALPTGASTAANQATEIADLNSIVTNTTGLATQATLAEIATDTDNLATIVTNTTGLATSANQTNGSQKTLDASALVPVAFDTIDVTATDGSDRPTTVLYKTGGLGGTTVATLTIVYDGSGNFQSVVRS